MPTYEYQCNDCGRVFEVRQRISEAALTRCDTCGGTLKRLISAAPFILKGEGWYVTDYPSESRKKALASDKKALASEKSGGESAGTKDSAGTKESSGTKDSAAAEKSSPSTSPSTSTSPAAPAPSAPSKTSSTD